MQDSEIVRPTALQPRIWTVFAAFLLALVLAIVLQVVAVTGIVIWHVAQGGDVQKLQTELTALLMRPDMFIFLGLLGQCGIGLSAIVPAKFSSEGFSERLAWRPPGLSIWHYPVFAAGTFLPLGIGLYFATLLPEWLPQDTSGALLYQQMNWQWAGPFLLFISLAPGFMEELLFRGYIQSRLLKRWPAGWAMLVSSVLFGLLHIMPQAVVFATVVGLWLGVVAWRTNSVWPGIACHAFVNGAWNVWQLGKVLLKWPDVPPTYLLIPIGLLVVGCFVVSVHLLWNLSPKLVESPE